MSSSLTSQRYSTSSQNPSVVPNASEIIDIATYGYSFQSREILQRVVLGEQQRLKEEQTLWRFGAAVLGSCLGLGDGFQLTDLFLGMASSTIAATAHEVLSNEDRQFLERCQLLWLVGNHSPIELSQRIGQARSRILFYDPSWQAPCIFNHHQGIRGDHLVPLGNAGNYAPGFADQASIEVLNRYFGADDLNTLRAQLYPQAGNTISISSVSAISPGEALSSDPFARSFLAKSQAVKIAVNDDYFIGYKVPIPAQSDF